MSHDEERYIRHHILYSTPKKTTKYCSLNNIKYVMDEIHNSVPIYNSLIKKKIKKLLDLNK